MRQHRDARRLGQGPEGHACTAGPSACTTACCRTCTCPWPAPTRSSPRTARRSRASSATAPLAAHEPAMPMFPQRLDSPLAYDIAKAMLDGFDRHYRLFRAESRAREAPLRDRRLARPAARAARAHRVLRPARARGGASGWRRNSRRASSRWTSGSRSSCTTSAC